MSQDETTAAPASSRRKFLRTSLRTSLQVSAVAGVVGSATVAKPGHAAATETAATSLIHSGDTILFQGDSITDVGRNRKTAGEANQQSALGNGYAAVAAASLLVAQPERRLKIYNRGISGNKVYQLDERWQTDCLDLKPNVLSILIGVNDIWHKLNGKYDGTVEKYETDYRALLERTKAALPQVRLVVCEPFVLRCGAVDEKWFPAFDGYRAAARRVSDSADSTFVPFQAMFEEAVKYAKPEHWLRDGVHPTAAGAALMADCWMRNAGH